MDSGSRLKISLNCTVPQRPTHRLNRRLHHNMFEANEIWGVPFRGDSEKRTKNMDKTTYLLQLLQLLLSYCCWLKGASSAVSTWLHQPHLVLSEPKMKDTHARALAIGVLSKICPMCTLRGLFLRSAKGLC